MLVRGLLHLSDRDLNGQWLGCPPEGDAGQGSRACLHPGVLPFRGRSQPATEAGTSLPWPTRADNLSEPSPLGASWGGGIRSARGHRWMQAGFQAAGETASVCREPGDEAAVTAHTLTVRCVGDRLTRAPA